MSGDLLDTCRTTAPSFCGFTIEWVQGPRLPWAACEMQDDDYFEIELRTSDGDDGVALYVVEVTGRVLGAPFDASTWIPSDSWPAALPAALAHVLDEVPRV